MARRYTGTILALAVAGGIYLGNKWKGPGLGGSGLGTATQTARETPAPGPVDRSIRVENTTSSRPSSTPKTTPELGAPPQLLRIVIHGDSYRQVSADDPSRGIDLTLEQIKQRVAEVPGNDVGLKVQIRNARDAHEGARSDLYNTLRSAGIKPEEIQEMSDFVD